MVGSTSIFTKVSTVFHRTENSPTTSSQSASTKPDIFRLPPPMAYGSTCGISSSSHSFPTISAWNTSASATPCTYATSFNNITLSPRTGKKPSFQAWNLTGTITNKLAAYPCKATLSSSLLVTTTLFPQSPRSIHTSIPPYIMAPRLSTLWILIASILLTMR